LLALATIVALSSAAPAQITTTLTETDLAEIKALSVTYRRALFECKAEEYADLFATPGGYFSSGPRGEVRDRVSLMEMVLSYDRCPAPGRAAAPAPAATPAAATGASGQGPRLPEPVYEWAPEGAKARIINSRGGGYYDDIYVKTPQGWRFKSRNVISDEELAAKLTTQDFIEIRYLAGDDHGHYENLYGPYGGEIGPHDPSKGSVKKPFRTSGLKLAVAPGGVKGLAYLRDNGGRYEDFYVKTPDGWRIKERHYFPAGE
jgi:hypothetical protein